MRRIDKKNQHEHPKQKDDGADQSFTKSDYKILRMEKKIKISIAKRRMIEQTIPSQNQAVKGIEKKTKISILNIRMMKQSIPSQNIENKAVSEPTNR
jgi:hypothetical protein